MFKSPFMIPTFTALGGSGGTGELLLKGCGAARGEGFGKYDSRTGVGAEGATLGVGVVTYELRGATGAILGVGVTTRMGDKGGNGEVRLPERL